MEKYRIPPEISAIILTKVVFCMIKRFLLNLKIKKLLIAKQNNITSQDIIKFGINCEIDIEIRYKAENTIIA